MIVKGNPVLTAPGQTTQLTLQATLSDGSTKDVTSTAQWYTSNGAVVTVSPAGLATAMGFGRATVRGFLQEEVSPGLVITVLPEGTYILSGRVTEAGDPPLSIADVRVETIGGPMSGRVAMTDGAGNYAFNGVSGVGQVRATKDGYEPAIQSRHTGHRAREYCADADAAVCVAWRRLLAHVYRVPILQPARRRHEAHVCGVD